MSSISTHGGNAAAVDTADGTDVNTVARIGKNSDFEHSMHPD